MGKIRIAALSMAMTIIFTGTVYAGQAPSTGDSASTDSSSSAAGASQTSLYPSLGEAPASATSACTDVEKSAGFIPCGRYTNDPATSWNECDACDFCSIPLALQLVLDFLIKLSGLAAVLAIVLGQLLAMTSVGDTDMMVKIKAALWKALLGFGYVMAAWLIVNALLVALGYTDPLDGQWYTVC